MRIVCGTGDERLDEALAADDGVEVVATAYHAEAVLAAADRHRPDAVLLSPRMLEEDWPTVVDALRAAGRRIVWLAGCAPDKLDREQVRMLIAAGVYDLICDPVSVADVVARLEKPMLPGQATALIDPPGSRRTTGPDLAASLRRFQEHVQEVVARRPEPVEEPKPPRERRPRRQRDPMRRADAVEPGVTPESVEREQLAEARREPARRPEPQSRQPVLPVGRGVEDALTGLPTRAAGEALLEQALERAEGRGDPLHVLFIDLDGFKQVNDTQGHKAGDHVLRRAARALAGAVRGSDAVVRWGGDEFLVILRADHEATERALWRLRQQAAAAGVAFSAGIAAWQARDTPETLVERADAAMYQDKQRHKAGVLTAGITVLLGALPGCGTSRAAIALAREQAAGGRDVLLVDAHVERAHLAHLLLGRHLDLLNPEDRARSWRHARGAEGLRRCAVELSSGLHLLALAFDPDPGDAPPVAAAPDLAVRFSRDAATVDVVCRPGFVAQDAVQVLQALDQTGRAVRVRAVADGFSDADRRIWSEGIGVFVADGAAKPAGAAVQLVAELTRALRICSTEAPAAVVDLGAPRPLINGIADPRVVWAAQNAQVVVVTRSDALGAEAAERLLTTMRAEADRAGVELQAEVLAGDRGLRQAATLPA